LETHVRFSSVDDLARWREVEKSAAAPLVKKPVEKKYRRSTGRRGAPNTGKVIEIAKEKARALNWRVTGAETGKTSN
jgi:hypothetical protein